MKGQARAGVIDGIEPYSEYKDSGLPWLGQVPSHWQIVRSKRLFSARKELARPDDRQLSATQAYGVIEQAEFERRSGHRVVKLSMHLDKRKHVEKDDFVISMRSFQGGIERAWASGAIRSSYVVLKPGPDVDASFFQYLLKSPGYIRALQATGDFIRDGQDLNFANFVRVDLPSVPLAEQAAIARFLDWASGRLERAIRAKRKVVALLNEQKQAIVRSAVARGLDSVAPLKSSGVPWLGEIPTHWEVWRISRFARVGNGSTPSRSRPSYWSGGTYPWLNSSQVNRGYIDGSDQFVTGAALRECHLPRVPAGSVLVAITGQGKTRGMAARLGIEATINQHVAFITPRRPVVSMDYLHLALTAAYPQLRAISDDSGSTKGALTCEDLKRFKIAVPPPREQEELVLRVQAETHALSETVKRLESEIELLREYRTRFVADVVTGKLDVRDAAARMPGDGVDGIESNIGDEADESELIDEEAAEA